MLKLRTLTIALGTLSLAAGPGLADSVRDQMKAGHDERLYNVEFRSVVDAHHHVTAIKVFKVTDDKGHNVTGKVRAPAEFTAAARVRIEKNLSMPHMKGTDGPGPVYNAFLYSPLFPGRLITDPDKGLNEQP
jgi:hypothetical protein